jgi:methyl-accepting chemotaxis protein-1 (serine sensor receptor)
VNTAKNLLADAQVHYDKYYACRIPQGWMRTWPTAGRAVPHLLRNADANERSAGQGNLEDMFKQNAEQKQNAMQTVYREWREAQAALTDKGIRIMKVTTSASCGSSLR